MAMEDIAYFFKSIFKMTDMNSWKDTWGRVDWGSEEHYNPKKIERQIRSLLEKGANPNTINSNDGRSTPLHLVAKRNGCFSSIAPLLEAGAEVDKKDALGKTPLSYAYTAIPNNRKLYIQKSLFPIHDGKYIRAEEETTSVHTLAKESFLALLEAGADINTHDNNGKTLLMYIRPTASLPKLLLECGADPDKQDNLGKTALMHWANQSPYLTDRSGIIYDSSASIKLLAQHSSDVNKQDNLGNTALTYARFVPENFSLLLDMGIDPRSTNKQGKSVLDQSISDQIKKIVQQHLGGQENPVEQTENKNHTISENKKKNTHQNIIIPISKERFNS